MDTSRDAEAPQDRPASASWSSPPPASQANPWSTQPGDTGTIPRPNDTHAIWASQLGGGAPPFPAEPTAAPAPKARPATALLVALALGAGVAGGVGGSAAWTALTDDTAPAVSSFDRGASDGREPLTALAGVDEVAAQVTPSVVSIGFNGPQGQGGGSGVIISSDGQILTNNHVAQAASGGTLTVTFHDGATAEAELIAGDPNTDIAVLQAKDVSGLIPADLGSSSDIRVGEQVVAIGSPHGLDGTVTTGIVSALNRPVTAGDIQSSATFAAIQTDAPINPGNSGGPLVNMAGQVIGINTAIATSFGGSGSIGLGFSIPIDQVKWIAEDLIEIGTATYARIGIGVNDGGQESVRGAHVANVEAGSAAEAAGLAEGDVVTRLDDQLVPDAETLVAMARLYRPGDEVTVTYIRDGEEFTLDITLGSSASST